MAKSKKLTDAQIGAILALRKVARMEFAYIAGELGCSPSTAGTIYNRIKRRAKSDTLPDLLAAVSMPIPRKKRKIRHTESQPHRDISAQQQDQLQPQPERADSERVPSEDRHNTRDFDPSISNPSILEGMKVKLPGGVEVQMTEEGTTRISNPRSTTSLTANDSFQASESTFLPDSANGTFCFYSTPDFEQADLPPRNRLPETREIYCW